MSALRMDACRGRSIWPKQAFPKYWRVSGDRTGGSAERSLWTDGPQPQSPGIDRNGVSHTAQPSERGGTCAALTLTGQQPTGAIRGLR